MYASLTQAVLKQFENDSTGHDKYHVLRVIQVAQKINEAYHEDASLVYLCGLLHDVFDEKHFIGSIETNLKVLLDEHQVKLSDDTYTQLLNDLKNMGFKGGFKNNELSLVGAIVQDADRLDAIGAIGIARTFAYGGSKGRIIYDPMIEYEPLQTKADYRQANRQTYFHFVDKLLKIKDLMLTQPGRQMAQERHQFMVEYLKQFEKETAL